ncbi:MAG: Fic family protein [Phycisphaeraceae bacterium]
MANDQFSQSSQRAGTYIQQPDGYRAFIPKPLPPEPEIHWDDELRELLSLADRAVARLDGASSILPNPDLFVFMYVRKEAVLSSQIEGTQASLSDVLEFEADRAKADLQSDVPEVLNYVEAMKHGLERLAALPISTRLLCEIHQPLLQGVRGEKLQPGELRRSQNWIGPKGISSLNQASFIPPPPKEMHVALDHLQKFINNDSPMPLLAKIGLVHAQFETIHPFLDGNGRVGRLLVTFMLCWKQALQRPLLYLSHYLKFHREEYYQRLQNVRLHGDWEGWLRFFLQGVYDVGQEATATARRIVELRERDRSQVVEHLGKGAATGLALLEDLYQHPVTAVNRAKAVTGTSYSSTNTLVHKLVDLNILTEITGQGRNRLFLYGQYLDLFRD